MPRCTTQKISAAVASRPSNIPQGSRGGIRWPPPDPGLLRLSRPDVCSSDQQLSSCAIRRVRAGGALRQPLRGACLRHRCRATRERDLRRLFPLHRSRVIASPCSWLTAFAIVVVSCSDQSTGVVEDRTVPRAGAWGIYALDSESGDAALVFSSPRPLGSLRVNLAGDRLVFSQRVDGDGEEHEEICTLHADGTGYCRLTDNAVIDVYACWSPDDTEIAFLSWRDADMDIYVMDSSGGNLRKLYDSGFHDADIDWVGDWMAFTRNSQIWLMTDSGDGAHRVTDPPCAGQWGNCNLPFGDYDPRLSPDAGKIVFERLEDDASVHGNHNIFVIDADGTGDSRLTDTGWSQGFAAWSRAGDKIAYLVAAVEDEARYDVYVMNADGTDNRSITPSYFPADFLCHTPVFAADDSRILFIGQWWE